MSSSARVPFVPASRPASRAAHLKDQPQHPIKAKGNPHFNPNAGNPLHNTSLNNQLPSLKSQQKSQANADGASQPSTLPIDKPLNTSGLLKKRNPSTALGPPQNAGMARRPSFPGSNAITRPGTADPHNAHRNQNQHDLSLKIAAPVPRQAPRPSSPSLSTNLASGVFALAPPASKISPPTPSQPQPTQEPTQYPKDAHTVPGLGFSLGKAHTITDLPQSPSQQLPSPPNTVRPSSTSVFESMTAIEPDHQIPPPRFTLNMSLSNQTGPSRVLLGSDGPNNKLGDPHVDQVPNADGGRQAPGRGQRAIQNQQPKRPRAEPEGDVSDDYDGPFKKNRNDVYKSRGNPISSPHQPSSPGQTYAMQMPTEYHIHDSHRHHDHPPLTPPQDQDQDQNRHRHHHRYQDQDVSMLDGDNDRSGTLDKLLGCDTDAYIEDHMEEYERAVNRWRECSMEEWISGADELAAKYVKILDFVKDHMTTKMKLFASLEAEVEKHNSVLYGREKTLDSVRVQLVKESRNVLGSGSGI